MPRIKIEDLPENMTISKEDMRKITGGFVLIERPVGDESTGSDIKTIPLSCNIGRIEVA